MDAGIIPAGALFFVSTGFYPDEYSVCGHLRAKIDIDTAAVYHAWIKEEVEGTEPYPSDPRCFLKCRPDGFIAWMLEKGFVERETPYKWSVDTGQYRYADGTVGMELIQPEDSRVRGACCTHRSDG